MFKKLIFTISLVLCSSLSLAKHQSLYSYAGILPIMVDHENQAWVYFGVEYINNKKSLALLAGGKEDVDPNILTTAVREMNEESLDVFSDYINFQSLTKNQPQEIDYNIWFVISTKLYLYSTKSDWADNFCDKFITLYNERRHAKSGNYQHLKLSQRENYELRKVKLEDLIKFLHDPNKFEYQLSSYGGKECSKPLALPLRWSSRIILRNQPSLENYKNSLTASN